MLSHFAKKSDPELLNFFKEIEKGSLEEFIFHFLIVENLNGISSIFDAILKQRIALVKHYWKIEEEQQNGLLKFFPTEENEEAQNYDDWFHSEKENKIVEELDKLVEQFESSYLNKLNNGLESGDFLPDDASEIKSKIYYPIYRNLANDIAHSATRYQKKFSGWHNTLFLLVDDLAINLEIDRLRFLFQKDFVDFSDYFSSQIEVPYLSQINNLANQIQKDNKMLSGMLEDEVSVSVEKLNKLSDDLLKEIKLSQLPAIFKLIDTVKIPEVVERVQQKGQPRFKAISKITYLIKNIKYDEPVSTKDFVRISPHEIIAYKMMPGYMALFPRLKTAFINYSHQIRLSLDEIPGIVNFSFVSGIRKLEEGKDSSDSISIICEGLNRAEIKVKSLIAIHHSFVDREILEFESFVNRLSEGLNKIKENENALQIKLEVTKLKAIEKSKALRAKVLAKVKNLLPVVFQFLKRIIDFLKLSSKKISSQLLVEKINKEFISSDISDYLVSFSNTISKLPYVYQQLFSFEALTDNEFYFERPKSWDKLNLAYQKWKDRKYAPVVVVGEKGAGKTTLFYKFLKSIESIETSVYINLNNNSKTADEHFDEIKKIANRGLHKRSGNSANKVVVVDGLEKLFTMKIDGFENIQKLIQLISATHQHIFWVFGCHLISWNYLNKTNAMSDYFGYTIKLPELSAEELMNLIELRHNMSGFRMGFVNNQTKKSILKFKKVSEAELQMILKDEYFEHLQVAVKGNITQAFLYWLVSTSKVEEDIIHFDWKKLPNSNFINTISKGKLLLLRAVLIENGLVAEELMQIFHCNEDQAAMKLNQFYDDGLLIKKDVRYFVNPLIYRQIIDELYNLNMLH